MYCILKVNLPLTVPRWARTGSTLPWWSTASSCGSSCLCACSARWACSCSHSSRITPSRPSVRLADGSAGRVRDDGQLPPPPTAQSAQQDNGWRWKVEGGGWQVWVLLCLSNWNQNWNWTAITPITFLITFFAKEHFSCMKRRRKKKEKKGKKHHHHTLTCSVFSSRCFMDWPPLSAGEVSLPALLFSQPGSEDRSDLLLVELCSQSTPSAWSLTA